MKIKTSQLSGPALDWAVAKATGEQWSHHTNFWRLTGPLFEKYCTALNQSGYGAWWAHSGNHIGEALTPLEAICRAIVASELGDEVDVPDELGGVE